MLIRFTGLHNNTGKHAGVTVSTSWDNTSCLKVLIKKYWGFLFVCCFFLLNYNWHDWRLPNSYHTKWPGQGKNVTSLKVCPFLGGWELRQISCLTKYTILFSCKGGGGTLKFEVFTHASCMIRGFQSIPLISIFCFEGNRIKQNTNKQKYLK